MDWLTQLGDSGGVLSLDVCCDDALAAITFRCGLLEQAAKRFAVEGIRISIPQTVMVLKDDRNLNRQPEKPSAVIMWNGLMEQPKNWMKNARNVANH